MKSFAVALLAFAGHALAQSGSSGIWTDHDWFDEEENVGVKNGIPYGIDPSTSRRIEAATLQSGPGVQNEDKENVRRIMEVFSEDDFEHLFPQHNRHFTYDSFLVAAGLYPKFCNEDDPSLGLNQADVCKRELATLFAHIIHETNAGEPEHAHEYFR